MLDKDELWSLTRGCFEADDGSLPDIEIAPLSSEGVTGIYAMLRRRSTIVSDSAEFWSRQEETSVNVDAVPNAAELVASGTAEAFHHCVGGLVSEGVELPTLGVFVFPDSISFDYRMGPEWGPAEVAGFFALLKECVQLAPGAEMRPGDVEGPPEPEQFVEAWKRFQ